MSLTPQCAAEAAAALRLTLSSYGPMSDQGAADVAAAVKKAGIPLSIAQVDKIMGRRATDAPNVTQVLRHLPHGKVTSSRDIAHALKKDGAVPVGNALAKAQGIPGEGACVLPRNKYNRQAQAFRFLLDKFPFWIVSESGEATNAPRERPNYLAKRGVAFTRYTDASFTEEDPEGAWISVPAGGDVWWHPVADDITFEDTTTEEEDE